MTANIFISFASKDVKMAMTLCTALENRGYKCWISARDIQPGENFQVAIVQAIRHAKIMLLVFTANSNASEEMTKELALASQQKMIVIPLRVEDVTPSDAFAYEFATRQWIDFFADWEFAIEQLSRRIANALRERGQGLETNDAAEALNEVAAVAPVAYTIDPPAKKPPEPAKPAAAPEPAKPAAKVEAPPVAKPEPPPAAPPKAEPVKPAPVAEKPAAQQPAPPKPAPTRPIEPIQEVRKEALDALKAAERPPAPPPAAAAAAAKSGIDGRRIAIIAGIAIVAVTAVGLAGASMMRSHRSPEPTQAATPAPPQTPTVVQVSNAPPAVATPPATNAVAALNAPATNALAVNAPVRKKAAAKPKADDIPF